MSSLIDMSNSIKASITDKVTHPLLGSFIISWLFFNWKAIYFLFFSNLDVVYKLKAVSENYSDLCLNLVFPLASSLALVFLLPLFTAGYTRFIAYTREFQMNSLPELFSSHSLTLEESNSLRNYYEHEFEKLKNELTLATEELTSYRTSEAHKIEGYKSKVNKIFDLFSNVKINQEIISSELSPQKVDKIIFFEALLQEPLHINKLLKDLGYKASNGKQLTSSNFDDELIEINDENNVSLTKKGIEELSNLKYEALESYYKLSKTNNLNGRKGLTWD
ncbi:hypothetical protein [Pseudoalteromonas sp. SR41-4]|uniref:hypothetical protein n=1 Tax=Pseudoalteromonas sp. SR41-4 TaxID=2760950 RepID=UPI0016016682|nr:hypothetical protein [Pseudoalteromonas sp. SR41-4]MBB1292996.1 hypothetical protein [Pseudoalteromonas sp. SR41-4]